MSAKTSGRIVGSQFRNVSAVLDRRASLVAGIALLAMSVIAGFGNFGVTYVIPFELTGGGATARCPIASHGS